MVDDIQSPDQEPQDSQKQELPPIYASAKDRENAQRFNEWRRKSDKFRGGGNRRGSGSGSTNAPSPQNDAQQARQGAQQTGGTSGAKKSELPPIYASAKDRENAQQYNAWRNKSDKFRQGSSTSAGSAARASHSSAGSGASSAGRARKFAAAAQKGSVTDAGAEIAKEATADAAKGALAATGVGAGVVAVGGKAIDVVVSGAFDFARRHKVFTFVFFLAGLMPIVGLLIQIPLGMIGMVIWMVEDKDR